MSIFSSLGIVFSSFIGIGTNADPRSVSNRILFISIYITGALLFWSYSAVLVSFLTVEKNDFPIKSYSVSDNYFFSLRFSL
jgi:hypothetical protein